MNTDFWMGAVWTLVCVLVGSMLTIVVFAVFRRDDPPGPGDDEDDPLQLAPDDFDLEAWLRENTITDPFESNLLGDIARAHDRVMTRIDELLTDS